MFDRSKWRTVTLSDVTTEISVRIDNPAEGGYDRFVGLEHFVAGQPVIRKWGSTENLVSAMKVCRAGDILIARRNVYLERAALVEFDALCSGDAIVLRQRLECLVPRYLQFVLNTEHFWRYANANADGSMSKRINVETLLKYEFNLPPIEEQKRITQLLWAADDVCENHRSTLNAINQLYRSQLNFIFRSLEQSEIPVVSLGKIGVWRSGGTPSKTSPEFWNGCITWVTPKDMKADEMNKSTDTLTQVALDNSNIRMLPEETILIVVRGMILAHTFPVAVATTPLTINQDMKGIIVSNDFLPRYIYHWFKYKSNFILRSTEESTHGTKRLSTDFLSKIDVPRAPMTEQYEIVAALEEMRKQTHKTKAQIDKTRQCLAQLTNHMIGM